MAKFYDYEVGKRVRRKAAKSGATVKTYRDGRVAFTSMEWDVAGSCQAPILVEGRYRRYSRAYERYSVGGKPVTLHTDIWTRCRTCDACLRARAFLWQQRAVAEWKRSPRTWLVTLTFRPEVSHRALAVARKALSAQGVDFEAMSSKDRFDAHARELGADVTLFLKRLRAGERGSAGDGNADVSEWLTPPAAFRYLLVTEAHKSGLPHFHLLVHEVHVDSPIRQAAIYRAWTAGFAAAKVVKDLLAATYVTKYLSKDNRSRVRASVGYGTVPNATFVHSRTEPNDVATRERRTVIYKGNKEKPK